MGSATRLAFGFVAGVLLASCVSTEPASTTVAPSSTSSGSAVTGVTVIDVPEPGEGNCAGDSFPAALKIGPAADLIAGAGDFVWISNWENALLTQVDPRALCVGPTLTVGAPRVLRGH